MQSPVLAIGNCYLDLSLIHIFYHLLVLCQWDRAVTPLSLSHYLHAFACLFAPNKGSLGMKEAIFISNFMGYDCNVVSNVLAVSYTHLDVYKRQVHIIRARHLIACSTTLPSMPVAAT